jgi:N-acetylmuramoyl-L-alanine amidase/LysM repeat protein
LLPCRDASPADSFWSQRRCWRRLVGLVPLLAWSIGLLAALPLPAFAAGTLAGRTIVLNAEEGGSNSGGIAGGVEEKNINLPTTLDTGALLTQMGARVVYTRTADSTVSLPARVDLANQVQADAFLTIAANTLSDPSFSGAITFYGVPNGYVGGHPRSPVLVAESRALAQAVQAGVIQATGEVNRGIQSAAFYVLGYATMPSILIETGFMTNPPELQKLITPSYQQTIAAGIVSGLAQYFSEQPAPALQGGSRPAAGALPSGATPSAAPFQPFWVETTQTTALFSGPSAPAVRLGNVAQWSPLLVLAPPVGGHLYVRNPATGGTAYVPALVVGPSGPPGGTSRAAPTNTSTYVVKVGDTVSSISRAFGVSEAALVQANHLANPSVILAGQTLQLPGGNTGFQPFWVANFVRTALWSGTDGDAKRLGEAAPFTPMQALAPAKNGRYLVRVWTTGGMAYVAVSAVGPVGAPPGAA